MVWTYFKPIFANINHENLSLLWVPHCLLPWTGLQHGQEKSGNQEKSGKTKKNDNSQEKSGKIFWKPQILSVQINLIYFI